jgi:hypothetical protein
LEKERQAHTKEKAGRLERILLQERVDMVLSKGATSAEGKWNNNDLKVMIQWFKRYGDKSMPKNKDGLLLRYRETHTQVVRTYPHYNAAAAPVAPDATAAVAAATTAATAAVAATRSTHDPNTFAVAATGNTAASHAAPVTLVATSDPRVPAAGAIVAAVAAASAVAVAVIQNPNPIPPPAHPLDWDDA